MKKLPPADKRIIFIHINGSHYNYASRVPFGYGKETLISSDNPYYDYDVTLAYTDKILHEIFDYAKSNLNWQTMIYFPTTGRIWFIITVRPLLRMIWYVSRCGSTYRLSGGRCVRR